MVIIVLYICSLPLYTLHAHVTIPDSPVSIQDEAALHNAML